MTKQILPAVFSVPVLSGVFRMLLVRPQFLIAGSVLATTVATCFATVRAATNADNQIAAARASFRTGDLDDALNQLEPLLKSDEVDQPAKQHARELAAQILQVRGEEHFRQARITKSVADFERHNQLLPDRAAENWQLGIAYYYAGDYEKGARQFELHRTVNPQDVENAAWHFLCVIRTPKQSIDIARKRLIPVTSDPRVPMKQIQQMFAGTLQPGEVLSVGEKAQGPAQFYADLYVGLYFEALNKSEESLRLIRRAADNAAAKDNYMGDVAKVHVAFRTKKSRPAKDEPASNSPQPR